MSGIETTNIDSCPFCGHSLVDKYAGIKDRLFTTPITFSVSECIGCSMAMINPAPTGDMSRFYPENYLSSEKLDEVGAVTTRGAGLERWYRYNQYAFDFGLLKRASGIDIAEAVSYVDIGCGSGERVLFAREQGCVGAFGVDRFDYVKVEARHASTIIRSEILDFKPAERVQVASLFHVLEHVDNPREVLTHISEHILQPNGRLVVQVPNYGSRERKLFGRRWFGLDVPRHLWDFNQHALTELLRQTGYEVEACYKLNAPLHPVTIVPSLFKGLDPQRIWVDPRRGGLSKTFLMALWAAATVLSIPLSVAQNLCHGASMLTVVAINK